MSEKTFEHGLEALIKKANLNEAQAKQVRSVVAETPSDQFSANFASWYEKKADPNAGQHAFNTMLPAVTGASGAIGGGLLGAGLGAVGGGIYGGARQKPEDESRLMAILKGIGGGALGGGLGGAVGGGAAGTLGGLAGNAALRKFASDRGLTEKQAQSLKNYLDKQANLGTTSAQSSAIGGIRAAQPAAAGIRPKGTMFGSAQIDMTPAAMKPVMPSQTGSVRG